MSVSAATISTLLDRIPTGLLINGEWVSTPAAFAVENPATEETLTEVADADVPQAVAALDAAVAAQDAWAATDPRVRGEILRRAFELITARAEDFALLMTLEMGKPLAEARGRGHLRGRVPPLVLRGGGPHRGPLRGRAVRRHPADHHEAAGRARSTRSPRGTSRWRWAPARSARRWPPAARW